MSFFESCISPLERGVLDTVFLLVMRGLMVCRIPLLRGDKGVCYGEGRGKGRWVARYGFGKLGVARCYQSASVAALGVSSCAWA